MEKDKNKLKELQNKRQNPVPEKELEIPSRYVESYEIFESYRYDSCDISHGKDDKETEDENGFGTLTLKGVKQNK